VVYDPEKNLDKDEKTLFPLEIPWQKSVGTTGTVIF
jgi:hypothetical protein